MTTKGVKIPAFLALFVLLLGLSSGLIGGL
jgi:hypothetical protein